MTFRYFGEIIGGLIDGLIDWLINRDYCICFFSSIKHYNKLLSLLLLGTFKNLVRLEINLMFLLRVPIRIFQNVSIKCTVNMMPKVPNVLYA